MGSLAYDLTTFGIGMTTRHQNRSRSFYSIACLLAVVLLYAPLAAAAWSSYAAGCCTSNQCPIKEHHHHQSPAAPENHMDCGHELSGMTACTMSCCHNPDRPFVFSVVFVSSASINIFEPSALQSHIAFTKLPDLRRSIEPLSPPPRLLSAAA
jgi:hypothetical protein